MADKARLDVALATRGLAESREKAQAMILSGTVFLNNQRADKASMTVRAEDVLEVRGAQHPYVSRGGLKLEKAMRLFGVDAQDVIAMDVGASTGGFTDVLLQAGARQVYSIDVGYGQLDWKLRNDPRVVVMERTNARHLTAEAFAQRPSLAVMDVSFISIRLILPALMAIVGDSGRIVTLVKPQFEAGRENVGKKGVVRDAAVHEQVLLDIRQAVEGLGWTVRDASYSPVTGPEGNIEFLFDLWPAREEESGRDEAFLKHIVAQAHSNLISGLQK